MEIIGASLNFFTEIHGNEFAMPAWDVVDVSTLFLLNLSTAYFLLDQVRAFYRHKKYSIRIQDSEKPANWRNNVTKMYLLFGYMLFTFGLHIVQPATLEQFALPFGFSMWIHTLLVIPVMIFKVYSELNFKFSLEQTSLVRINSETLYLIMLVAREAVLLFRAIFKVQEFTYTFSNWATCALPALRLISVVILLYLIGKLNSKRSRTVPTSEGGSASEEGSTEETDEKKNLSPIAIWTLFYSFKTYFVPEQVLDKLGAFAFIGFIALDAFVDLYSSITYRRILDSLHITGENSNNSSSSADAEMHPGYSIKLEYRWDYLVIFAIIKFSRYNVVGHLKYHLKKHIQTACCCRLQIDLFTKLHKLSLRWHLENKPVEVNNLMTSGSQILMVILNGLCWATPECLIMVVQLVYLIKSYSYKLSGVVICTGTVSVILDICVLRWRDKTLVNLHRARKEAREKRADSFENFETVKYFTNETYEKEKYRKSYMDEKRQTNSSAAWYSVSTTVRELTQGIAELGVILIVVRAIINEEGLTAGDYIYFSSLFTKIMNPVETVVDFYKQLQENALDLEKVMKVLQMEPEIADEPDASPLKIPETGGSIEFRNVSFSYTPDRQILSNVSFTIPAGRTVAFVGHSGCGKSTIAKLLFRFYDPTSGEILVEGQDIRKVQCESLRRLIGVVPQDIVLFDETVKNNIRYGNILHATEEDVISAANLASLHERIDSFPEKYNTLVGSRGLKLSGGEKQRVALARTIVKNPPIVILDEATSSLDTETERQIQSSLNRLCKNRTCFIIAHRLSTIVHADKIVVLNNGGVVEIGTHEELIAKNGSYTKMWNQQFNSLEQDNTVMEDSSDLKRQLIIRIEDVNGNSTQPER